MSDVDELKDLIRAKLIIPFVGAGFSVNMGLPTWSELIDFIAAELGYDPEIFQVQGNAMQLAEYYLIKKKGNISELTKKLKSWFDGVDIDITTSEQHLALVRLNSDIIYTTNYDNLIEKAFLASKKKYFPIVRIDDIRKCKPNTTQIVKFHGTVDDDDSIVLAESHYFNRLSLESALDIKLRYDLMGRSLLFIGYGYQDINIRYMGFNLLKLWKLDRSVVDDLPKSYFLGFGIGEVQKTIMKEMYNIVAIDLDPENKTESLVTFLNSLV